MAKNKTKNPQQVPQKQNIGTESVATPTISKIASESIITKYAFSIFLMAMVLTGFFIFKDYLLGKAAYQFKDIGSDSINLTHTILIWLHDYWRTEGMPSWSFQQGMGLNLYPFFFDQFFWVIPFFSKENIPFAIVWVTWFEIMAAGVVFFFYLKMLNLTRFAALIGGLCYAYCAYGVISSTWVNRFEIELFNNALLLLALERFFQKKSWWLIPIAIALMTIDMPFNLYPFSFLILGYCVFRHLIMDGHFSMNMVKTLAWMLGLGTLGVAMGAVMGFGELDQMMDSPRVSGGQSFVGTLIDQGLSGAISGKELLTCITRTFSNDMQGTGLEYQGWSNYLEAPMFYVGLLSLVCLPQLFQFTDVVRIRVYVGLLIVVFIPILLPFFRFAFWAFTGDYYRTYSLFVGITLLTLGMKALSEIEKQQRIDWKILLLSVIGLSVLLFLPLADDIVIQKGVRSLVILFLIINAGLLWLISSPTLRNIGQIALLLIVCVDLGINASRTINISKREALTREELSEKTGFNDYSNDAISYVKSIEKSPFYRIEKGFGSGPSRYQSTNDAKCQNYYGIKSYHSFNQPNYIRFMTALKVVDKNNEITSRWCTGSPMNTLWHSIVGVKYFLTRTSDNISLMGYDSLKTFNDIKLVKNRFAMPLGITYDTYMTEDDFEKNNYPNIYASKAMLKSCVVDKNLLSQLSGLQKNQGVDTTQVLVNGELEQDYKKLTSDILQISSFTNTDIKGKISLKSKKILFLSIPFDKGWHATVNDKETDLQRVQWGLTGLVLNKGEHKIELSFTPPYRKEGAIVSLIALGLFGLGLVITQRKAKTV
jgi:Bacterial membrane protein YfhO